MLGMVAVISASLAASSVSAAFPKISYIRPLGVVRGEESTITLHGSALGDATEVLTDLPGLEILEVKPVDEKSVTVKLKADEKLAPGLYPVRLVTKSGITDLRLIGVGTMPIVNEVEPNNSFEETQAIEMDRTIEGNIDREDVDCFKVHLEAGQKLTVEIEGIRLVQQLNNRNIFDPAIAILNSDRFEVAVSDDSSLLQQDSLCSFTPEEAGDYTIVVRESSFLGAANVCGYRLHVGSFPRPVTVIPSGGVKGEVLQAKLIDVDGTVTESSVQLPSEPVEKWPVTHQDDRGISPSPNWIRVSDAPIVTETEPNEGQSQATPGQFPALLCGVIEEGDGYDWFSFECKKGDRVQVQLHARKTLRSPLDGVIHVFGPDGKTLKGSDDIGPNPDGSVDFDAAVDGNHFVRVYDHLRSGSPNHNYVIELSRREPSLGLTLKELRRDEAMVVPVPVGGHSAMVLTAQRNQFNEQFDAIVEGLPEGVTAQTFPMPAGRVEIPVVFHASKEAALGGAFFEVGGVGKLGDREIRGDFQQHHKVVLGQNRREMLGYETEKAALAVCEAMPFSVEVVQPKTPILRRGSKDLLVRIKRDEGFEGTVSFRTLYNPPGIGVNNSKRIEKGQSEVIIPITANGSAAIGSWPMVMQVSYGTNRGTATMSTAPIMLDVEEPVFDFAFPKSAAEQGAEAILAIGMTKRRDIEGDIEVRLVGIPNGVTCDEPQKKVELGSESVQFLLKVAPDAKPGTHKTMVVQTLITREGETMMQTDGTGEIRIDKPLPVKQDPPAEKKPEAKPKPKPAAKPLSRLEQLRQQKESK
ncbi:pre-peptidase C-terminal domain-containing protein [Rhodopirellula islandica]|uniref:pre-peptidase C-terminal domain-containing protein n=1 Tax=Rhodopirellula islandica TaxID=595434 RepID=UPI00064A4188